MREWGTIAGGYTIAGLTLANVNTVLAALVAGLTSCLLVLQVAGKIRKEMRKQQLEKLRYDALEAEMREQRKDTCRNKRQ